MQTPDARDYAKAVLNALGHEVAPTSRIDKVADIIRRRDAQVRAEDPMRFRVRQRYGAWVVTQVEVERGPAAGHRVVVTFAEQDAVVEP